MQLQSPVAGTCRCRRPLRHLPVCQRCALQQHTLLTRCPHAALAMQMAAGPVRGSTFMHAFKFRSGRDFIKVWLEPTGRVFPGRWRIRALANNRPVTGNRRLLSGTTLQFVPGAQGVHGRLIIDAGKRCSRAWATAAGGSHAHSGGSQGAARSLLVSHACKHGIDCTLSRCSPLQGSSGWPSSSAGGRSATPWPTFWT